MQTLSAETYKAAVAFGDKDAAVWLCIVSILAKHVLTESLTCQGRVLEGCVAAWQGCAPQCVPRGAQCMAATNITLISSLEEVKPWRQAQVHVMPNASRAFWQQLHYLLGRQCGT